MGVHAAPRLQAFSYVGVRDYSITCCTFERYCWFEDVIIVDAVRAPLLQLAREDQFEISAYCFMPDHVHILTEGTSPTSNIRKLIQRWKQKTGYAHRCATGGRLWQGGYYDHVLRENEDRHAAIRYLLSNPIRAGLVSDVRDYPFGDRVSGAVMKCSPRSLRLRTHQGRPDPTVAAAKAAALQRSCVLRG
jgi:putative transposase